MYTVDASVHVNAANPTESGCETSQTFLRLLRQYKVPQVSPVLLLAEVAAAVARALNDSRFAIRLATMLRTWPGYTLVPLEGELVDRAIRIGASARLRSADAVYAAVAEQYDTALVTLDRQQQERLPSLVKVLAPADAILELQTQHSLDESGNEGPGI